MESVQRKLQKNPRRSAGLISVLFFGWSIPYFKATYNKTLYGNDASEPLPDDKSNVLGDRLEKTWQVECKNQLKPSLTRAVLKTFWYELFIMGILCFISELVLRLALSFVLDNFLSYFRKDSVMAQDDALNYGTAIFVVTVVLGICAMHYTFLGSYYGTRIRVAICSLIYRKLSQPALSNTSPGKLVNLLSNDMNRLEVMIVFVHFLWISPLLTVIAAYILWQETQWAGMIGMAVVFLIVPIQSYSGKISAVLRFKTALRTDERVRFMDEIISGVQVIKMYAWEMPFSRLITTARRLELKMILKNAYVRALYMTFSLFTTRIALFCTVLAIIVIYGCKNVTVSKIFMISYLFNVISIAMCQAFVRAVAELGETLVAFERVQMFLAYEEKEQFNKKTVDDPLESQNVAVSMKNVTAGWVTVADPSEVNTKVDSYKTATDANSNEVKPFKLEGINLNIAKGQLVFVIGSVGAGKSTLTQVLLKELPVICGSMGINGSISYASQESWIFASTIRQNITFGAVIDHSRYSEILRSTDLTKDLNQFSAGDLTVLGENGSGLSGGQKSRINLARALYRKADIYLIDDPLSAVDTHVQSHLFDECIGPKGFLARKNATRILITHQVHFLKDADWIVVLKDGKIETQGDYNYILKSGIDFASILREKEEIHDEEYVDENEDDELIIEKFRRNSKGSTKRESIRRDSKASIRRNSLSFSKLKRSFSVVSSVNEKISEEIKESQTPPEDEGKLLSRESDAKGKIEGSLLLHYLKSSNRPFLLVFLIASFLLVQILASAADIWVSYWIRQEEIRTYELDHQSNFPTMARSQAFESTTWSTKTYTNIYAVIMVSLFVIALIRSVVFFKICAIACQKLHDSMFNGMISTTMRFFNLNPSGRIINRFSKDMGSADETLPKSLLDAAQINLNMLGAILVTVYTNALFSIVILIMGVFFLLVRKVYLKISTNIKRLEATTKSPVFGHISATLNGLSTIRAFQVQNILREEFENHQNLNTGVCYMFIATSSGFGMALDLMAYVFIGCVIYYFTLVNKDVTGDRVGLAITQSLTLAGYLQWGVRQSAAVTNFLTSVERILEYTKLEPEMKPKIPITVATNWPECGKIEFQNVFFRYSMDSEPVLRGMSFNVNPKEKISVVGRTGAGKSSLINSIFRLAPVDGVIMIDDVNTACIDLNVLRSKISIIPQEPTLFSGTLRKNLDPFEEYTDADIWKALENVGMKEILSEGRGLHMPVLARGQNFSTGQRQILCLARAILRNSRLIIMDEATANVDLRTDEMIQRTIREKFIDSTVITVSHRLNIVDSDRVLVMDTGTAVEFDEPYLLLQKRDGTFRKMVEALGSHEFERLLSIARDKFKNSRNKGI